MFFGLSHVDVPVRDLERALRLYHDTIGFGIERRGEGWADLNPSTALIRLRESATAERPVSMRIEVPDVGAATDALVAAGVELIYHPGRTEQLTIEATLRDPDSNLITLWRNLSEDEYDFEPELPKEMTWDDDAEAMLKSLLKSVPALFRGLARRKIVKEAETRASKTNRIDRDLAIRSFISAQSPPNRGRLREPLRKHGIDPDDYRDEFDS
jgi:catechol 2,3-dioxygenase-like lactoylglutathione lyase family enzyme